MNWWQDPGCEFAKVTYMAKEGYETKAYIDLRTGRGDNKHTDEPVHVVWDEAQEIWKEKDS